MPRPAKDAVLRHSAPGGTVARDSLLPGVRVDDRPARRGRCGRHPAALDGEPHPGPRHDDPHPRRAADPLRRREPLALLPGRRAYPLAARVPGDARLGPLPRRAEDLLVAQTISSVVPFLADALVVLGVRSEEHTSELQSRQYLVCRLL